MRKNKSKLNKISLKKLYSDLKKVTGKRTSKFGNFKQRFKNVVRKHGKTIAVVGGAATAVAGTAAAMHYRNQKQLEAKNKEIQSKEEQFHAKELEANAAIQNIKDAQAADKKLLEAEKNTAKKLEAKNKELEKLAQEKEELRKKERLGDAIQVAFLKNKIKDRTKSLQDKEAALKEAIANQKVAFTISVAEKEEEKNDLSKLSSNLPSPPPPVPAPPPPRTIHKIKIPKKGKKEEEIFEDALTVQPESGENIAKIVKLQALVRGGIARRRTKNIKAQPNMSPELIEALNVQIDPSDTDFEQDISDHHVLKGSEVKTFMEELYSNISFGKKNKKRSSRFGYDIDNKDNLNDTQKKLLKFVIKHYTSMGNYSGVFGTLIVGLKHANTDVDEKIILGKMLNYLYKLYNYSYARERDPILPGLTYGQRFYYGR